MEKLPAVADALRCHNCRNRCLAMMTGLPMRDQP
jgi:hypothetical protein